MWKEQVDWFAQDLNSLWNSFRLLGLAKNQKHKAGNDEIIVAQKQHFKIFKERSIV